MNIIGRRKYFYILSTAIILVGIISLLVRGLNLGIDFTGGTAVQIELNEAFTTAEVRELIDELNLTQQPIIRTTGEFGVVHIETEALTQTQLSELFAILQTRFENLEEGRVDQVDPVFSRDLIRNAFLALLIASVAMIAYITWRFEFKFGIAAIIALLHDVIVVLAVFSIAQVEVNVAFVAALLTIVGYSINDTIVIFDRVRENLTRMGRRDGYATVVNTSLLQTLRRSIYTSTTTLLVVGSILFFGGVTLMPIALALFVGMISGTYSSIFVASPIWVDWKERTS